MVDVDRSPLVSMSPKFYNTELLEKTFLHFFTTSTRTPPTGTGKGYPGTGITIPG